MIIVSACLAGINCTYEGKNNSNDYVKKLIEKGEGIVVCPEQLGGLPTPRTICQLDGGDGADVLDGQAKIISKDGMDLTENFVKGAEEALYLAKLCGASTVILKAMSPSCGSGKTASESGLIDGDGVTTALFKRHGIKVISEEKIN
jgi:uncharacterized protein YbbK (DUF523 family)